jgi:hypothetical protein
MAFTMRKQKVEAIQFFTTGENLKDFGDNYSVSKMNPLITRAISSHLMRMSLYLVKFV